MRPGPIALLLVTLWLAPAPRALAAPEDAKQERPAPATSAEDAAAAELKELEQDLRAASSAYGHAVRDYRAKKKEDPAAKLSYPVHPRAEYAAKFRDAATRHAGTKASTTLLIRAFELAYRGDKAVSIPILDGLLDDHMQSEQLSAISFELIIGAFYLGRDAVTAAMTRIVDESPHDAVKAAFLHARASLVNRRNPSSAEERAAAVADLERAMELGAGTRYGEMARSVKFELENLQVGMPAPEIEGEDLDGVAFKLSDYRGKVVVLDFWGDW